MSGEFINPNWHVVIMHFPMGLLSAGVLVELIALGWPGRGFRGAGRWMILLGALASVPTLLSGLYALRQTVLPAPPDPDMTWADVVSASPWSADQWKFMTNHILLNSIAVAVFALVAVTGLAVADRPRTGMHWPLLIVLLVGMGLVGAGAWFGGESVYRLGTAVVIPGKASPPAQVSRSLPPEGTSAVVIPGKAGPPAQVSRSLPPEGTSTTLPAAAAQVPAKPDAAPEYKHEYQHEQAAPSVRDITYFISPLQLHVVLAGLAVAFALGALGLTMRRWQGRPEEYESENSYSGPRPVLARPGPHAAPPINDPLTFSDDASIVTETVPPPASPRAFWLLGALVLALTALAGAWSFQGGISADAWRTNLNMLRDPEHLRVLIHVIVGVVLLLLALVSGIARRLAWRHRAISKIFALLLLVTVVVQLWLGIAILFDSHTGPLLEFTPPATTAIKS